MAKPSFWMMILTLTLPGINWQHSFSWKMEPELKQCIDPTENRECDCLICQRVLFKQMVKLRQANHKKMVGKDPPRGWGWKFFGCFGFPNEIDA